MGKAKKIASNTVISVTARIIGLGLALVIVGLLTRKLKAGGYGNYTTVIAYLSIFTSLADLGLYNFLLRDISREDADEKKLASHVFTIRLVTLALITPLAIGVAFLLPYPLKVKIGIAIAGTSAVLLSLDQVLMPIFQKYLKMIWVAIAEVIGRAVQLGLVFLGVKLGFGLFYFLGGLVIANLSGFLIQLHFARGLVPFGLAFNLEKWKKIFKKALPIGVGIILTLIYFKLDTVMLSLLKDSEAVGIYGLAYKVLENLIFFPSMLVGLVTPLLSKYAFKDRASFKKVFQKTLDFIVLVMIPACVGLAFLAKPVVGLLGGENFGASAQVLRILTVAIGLIFLGNLLGKSAIVLKKQVWAAWVYFIGVIVNLGANFYFIPQYSYLGAALTTVITELTVTALLFLIVYKSYKWCPNLLIFAKSALAVLPMGIFLYFQSGGSLILNIAGGASIYFVLLFLFRGVTRKDIKTLLAIKGEAQQTS